MAANQLLPMINNFEYRLTFLVNGHIMLNAPVLVRSPKLSSIEPRQYLDGRPPGNTGCCWQKSFLSHWSRLENLSNYGVYYGRGKFFSNFLLSLTSQRLYWGPVWMCTSSRANLIRYFVLGLVTTDPICRNKSITK